MLTTQNDRTQINQYKAAAIERYGLVQDPNRKEELRHPNSDLGVSFGYGCGAVRIRLMEGREWRAYVDHLAGEPKIDKLFSLLDTWFKQP